MAKTTLSRERFEAILAAWRDRVYATAYRVLGNAADADDATQDVFRRLLRMHSRYDDTQGFDPWFQRLMSREILNAARARDRKTRLQKKAARMTGTTPPDPLSDETQAAVQQALNQLSAADRLAVTLRYIEGQSQRDVAAALNVSESAMHYRLRNALDALRGHLAKAGFAVLLPRLDGVLRGLPMPVAPPSLALTTAALYSAPEAALTMGTLIVMKKSLAAAAVLCLLLIASCLLNLLSTANNKSSGNEPLISAPIPDADAPAAARTTTAESATEQALAQFNSDEDAASHPAVESEPEQSASIRPEPGAPTPDSKTASSKTTDTDTITGRLTDINTGLGLPESRLMFYAQSRPSGSPAASATTDDDGTFTIQGLERGRRYVVQLYKIGFSLGADPYNPFDTVTMPQEGEILLLNAQACGGVAGRLLLDPEHEDARIRAKCSFDNLNEAGMGIEGDFICGEDGSFFLPSCVAYTYYSRAKKIEDLHVLTAQLRIQLEGCGRIVTPVRFQDPSDVIQLGDLKFEAHYSARGRVIDDAGQPLAGVTIEVRDVPGLDPMDRMMLSSELKAVTATDGCFEIDGIPGDSATLLFFHTEYEPLLLSAVLGPGRLTDIRLQPGKTVTARVLDAKDRSGIAGVPVSLQRVVTSEKGMTVRFEDTRLTDAEGLVAFTGVMPGGQTIRVDANGLEQPAMFEDNASLRQDVFADGAPAEFTGVRKQRIELQWLDAATNKPPELPANQPDNLRGFVTLDADYYFFGHLKTPTVIYLPAGDFTLTLRKSLLMEEQSFALRVTDAAPFQIRIISVRLIESR